MTKQVNNLRKRHKAEKRFKFMGLGAIGVAFLFLSYLLISIFGNGLSGFWHTEITLKVTIDEADAAASLRNALDKAVPNITDYDERKDLYSLIAQGNSYKLEKMLATNKQLNGKTIEFDAIAEAGVDIFYKQKFDGWEESITPKQKDFLKILEKKNLVHRNFNFAFFTSGDSQDPEMAGIAGAMIGSLLTVIISLLIALPIGIMTAIYLEEFAPKNKFTDFIEVNINNLAAVPSIVFGLLGLAVYLNYFGLPRSAPIVGGMTLALMTIPVVIIAARAALKAVPPSIRQAAMGLGASPLQTVMHHSLPLALPGIMTGAILGLARALGETAPLLMIGMVAFIADIPSKFSDPATAMPVQIFLWSKNNQPGFIEKTAAAIIVLLVILIAMNIIAVWIRKKYERRW